MYAIAFLIVVALVSLLLTRVATIVLTVTGMSRESARFQARSALSGVGFTTSEAESVVRHPIRRRIVMALMLIGSVGLATAIAGLLGGFLRADTTQALRRGALLVGGLVAVYLLALSPWVDRRLSRLVVRALRRFTDVEVHDFARLLHLSGEYSVKEITTEAGHWIVGRPLGELRLRDEGVLVLGVVGEDGSYVGAPGKEATVKPGETVILYGQDSVLADLGNRRAGPPGERAHARLRREERRLPTAG